MVFAREVQKSLSGLKNSKSETKEELELANFLREFQDLFINNILGEMPLSRGVDNLSIDLVPRKHTPK